MIVIVIIPFTGLYRSFHWANMLLVFCVGIIFSLIFLKFSPRENVSVMGLVISSLVGMMIFPLIGFVTKELFKDPFWIGATLFFFGADMVDIIAATVRQSKKLS